MRNTYQIRMQGHFSAWLVKHGLVHWSLGFDYQYKNGFTLTLPSIAFLLDHIHKKKLVSV